MADNTKTNKFWSDFHKINMLDEYIYDILSHNGMHLEIYNDETDKITNCGYLIDNNHTFEDYEEFDINN